MIDRLFGFDSSTRLHGKSEHESRVSDIWSLGNIFVLKLTFLDQSDRPVEENPGMIP